MPARSGWRTGSDEGFSEPWICPLENRKVVSREDRVVMVDETFFPLLGSARSGKIVAMRRPRFRQANLRRDAAFLFVFAGS
jgi:hypothetical protein